MLSENSIKINKNKSPQDYDKLYRQDISNNREKTRNV